MPCDLSCKKTEGNLFKCEVEGCPNGETKSSHAFGEPNRSEKTMLWIYLLVGAILIALMWQIFKHILS